MLKCFYEGQRQIVELQEIESFLNSLKKPNKIILEQVLESLEQIAILLKDNQSSFYRDAHQALFKEAKYSLIEIKTALSELAAFCQRDQLEAKIQRELESLDPFTPQKIDLYSGENNFECFEPVGCLGHILPQNDPIVGILSILEGLLTLNINKAKLSSRAGDLLFVFFEKLIRINPNLSDYVLVFQLGSDQKNLLKKIFSQVDAIAVWGGSDVQKQAKDLVEESCKILDWGHKISICYLTPEYFYDKKTLESLAYEICLNEQLSCSAPQVLYLDTNDVLECKNVAKNFQKVLDSYNLTHPRKEVEQEQKVQIALTQKMLDLKKPLNLGHDLFLGPLAEDGIEAFRLLIGPESTLEASPLYRSLWIRPLPRENILTVLSPYKRYLQTLGLGSSIEDFFTLQKIFIQAGILRINSIGQMQNSYLGAPHDGRLALREYTKKVSYQLDSRFSNYLRLDVAASSDFNTEIMRKDDFIYQNDQIKKYDLVFKSGGSSGEAKFSHFTYQDYYDQMQTAALGLSASGFSPKTDKVLNLFFAGGLYGGFVSFFSVLEFLKAKQFPMGAPDDTEFVIYTIKRYQINALLGMPSYLLLLFERHSDFFKKHKYINKIFYGGEPFTQAQKKLLSEEFNITLIKSAGYGSVDAGPLGFQCSFCEGGVHHLHDDIQHLEIVPMEDNPTLGKLLFSCKRRSNLKINRYDIGDLGRWVEGSCPCGRLSPRFELLGRHGDIFRVASIFLNYQMFRKLFDELLYQGPLQLEVKEKDLTIFYLDKLAYSPEQAKTKILAQYKDLDEVVTVEKLLRLHLKPLKDEKALVKASSGKIICMIDRRI